MRARLDRYFYLSIVLSPTTNRKRNRVSIFTDRMRERRTESGCFGIFTWSLVTLGGSSKNLIFSVRPNSTVCCKKITLPPRRKYGSRPETDESHNENATRFVPLTLVPLFLSLILIAEHPLYVNAGSQWSGTRVGGQERGRGVALRKISFRLLHRVNTENTCCRLMNFHS